MKLEWVLKSPVDPGLLSLMQIAADQAARAGSGSAPPQL